jgi:hypothetical protein
MNREEYIALQVQLAALGSIVKDMPLGDFIQAIDQADTFGPVLDPTLWRKSHRNMNRWRNLAEALLPFKRAVLESSE